MNLRDLALKFKDLSPTTKQWLERALWLTLALLACSLLRACYPRVEVTTEVKENVVKVEDTKRLDEAHEQIRTLTSQVTHWQTVANRKTTTKSTPVLIACDGGAPVVATETTTTVDETNTGSGGSTDTASTATNKDTKRTEDLHREEQLTKTTTVTVTAVPDWRVSLYIGAQVPAPLLPIAGPLTLGVGVERHIIGPVSAGVMAHTGLGVMGTVSASF